MSIQPNQNYAPYLRAVSPENTTLNKECTSNPIPEDLSKKPYQSRFDTVFSNDNILNAPLKTDDRPKNRFLTMSIQKEKMGFFKEAFDALRLAFLTGEPGAAKILQDRAATKQDRIGTIFLQYRGFYHLFQILQQPDTKAKKSYLDTLSFEEFKEIPTALEDAFIPSHEIDPLEKMENELHTIKSLIVGSYTNAYLRAEKKGIYQDAYQFLKFAMISGEPNAAETLKKRAAIKNDPIGIRLKKDIGFYHLFEAMEKPSKETYLKGLPQETFTLVEKAWVETRFEENIKLGDKVRDFLRSIRSLMKIQVRN